MKISGGSRLPYTKKKKIVFVQYKKVQASPSKQFTFLVYIRLYIENDSLS